MDPLTGIIAGVRMLMDTKMAIFVNIALGWTVYLGVIQLVFDAANAMAGGRGHKEDYWPYIRTILWVVVARVFLVYYDAPMPGYGGSIVHIIIDESTFLTGQLNVESSKNIWLHLDTLWKHFLMPDWWAWAVMVPYLGLLFVIFFCKMALMFVTAGSYAFFAVCVVLGPLFVPWIIIPGTRRYFTGWLMCSIEFAFLPVVAAAFSMVQEQFIFAFLSTMPPNIGILGYPAYLYQAIVVIGTMAVLTLAIPKFTSGLMAGRAHHEHAGGALLGLMASI